MKFYGPGCNTNHSSHIFFIKSKNLVYENCNVCNQSRTAAVGNQQEGDCLTNFVVLYPASELVKMTQSKLCY